MDREMVRAVVAVVVLVAGWLAAEPFRPRERGTYARLDTSMGEIVVRLFEDTPLATANFVGLAEGTKEWTDPRTGQKVRRPFYDGLTFHRVIADFMIQGGCPVGDGTGGPGYTFADECYSNFEPARGVIRDEEAAVEAWQNIIVPAMRRSGGRLSDEKVMAVVNAVMASRSGRPLYGWDLEELQRRTGVTWKKGKGLKRRVTYGTLCMANAGPDSNGSQFFIVTRKAGCPWLDGKHTVFGEVVSGMEVAHRIEAVEKGPNDRPKRPVVIRKVTIERVP